MALLDGLRTGLQADVVALVDDDRSDPADEPPANFWEPLGRADCADAVWASWYRALRSERRAEAGCGCGAGHRLHGFLIYDRWVLMVVPTGPVRADGAAAIASCVRALADCLPPGRGPVEASTTDPTDRAAPVIREPLVWWVRRQPH